MILKRGSKGDSVRDLQNQLNKAGFSLPVDGIFGTGTETAVKLFQKTNGLVPDGIAGPKTLAKLQSSGSLSNAQNKPNPNNSADPSGSLKVSQKGAELICSFEGLRLKPYLCSAGVPTIGYGSTVYENGTKVKLSDPSITKDRAVALFRNTLGSYENAVNKGVKVPINQNQFDALVSLAYNIGVGGFTGSSLLKKLNAKDYQGAADSFLAWNKERKNGKLQVSNGLTNRRTAERKLFLSK